MGSTEGPQILGSTENQQILGSTEGQQILDSTEGQQTLGCTVHNLVTVANFRPQFVHPLLQIQHL